MQGKVVFAIPNKPGWPVESLADLCTLISRGSAPVYVERSDVQAIGQRCVTRGGFEPRMARAHSSRAVNGLLLAEAGDVLLNSTGTGTIGRSCVFDACGTFMVDGHVTVLRPAPGRADGRWLNALLHTPWGQTFLETQCYSGSTNQVELSRTRLAQAGIATPPLSEQRQVAAVLDAIDDAIRKAEQIIAKLKQVKQGLLHNLLTRGIDDNGQLRDPERHPEQFKDSPLGRIPRGWNVVPARELCSLITKGTTPSPKAFRTDERTVRFLRVDNLTFSGSLDLSLAPLFIDRRTHETTLARSRVQENDVLMNIVGPPLGKVSTVPPGKSLWNVNQAIAIFRVGARMSSSFLATWLLSGAQMWFRREAKQTSGQLNLTLEMCGTVPVPVSSEFEQQRILSVLSELDSELANEDAELRKLRLLKTGLMEDLLTGRVRVTNLLDSAAE